MNEPGHELSGALLLVRSIPRMLAVASALMLAACSTVPLVNFEQEASEILGSRKPASFRQWSKQKIGEESSDAYANNRTSPLFAGEISIQVEDLVIDKTTQSGRANLFIKGYDIDLGTATEISPDGYYLTAAHCVDQSPLHLLIGDEQGMRQIRARIVWRGAPYSTTEPDLALIHIPRKTAKFFALAAPGSLPEGAQIYTAGYGSFGSERRFVQYSGGRVLHTEGWKEAESGARWMTVHHSAPLSTGDSGGPVIDKEGRLAGINTEISLGFMKFFNRGILRRYSSTAICPDPQWIQALIEADRAAW